MRVHICRILQPCTHQVCCTGRTEDELVAPTDATAGTSNFVPGRGQHIGLTLRDQHGGEVLSIFPSVQCSHPVAKTFANPYEAKVISKVMSKREKKPKERD